MGFAEWRKAGNAPATKGLFRNLNPVIEPPGRGVAEREETERTGLFFEM